MVVCSIRLLFATPTLGSMFERIECSPKSIRPIALPDSWPSQTSFPSTEVTALWSVRSDESTIRIIGGSVSGRYSLVISFEVRAVAFQSIRW